MENGQQVDMSTVANTMRMPVNLEEQVSDHDAMARRLKNRERQRRYRARKRLLADLKKAQAIDPSVPAPRDVAASDKLQEHVTRVHCQRDWKKDARRAHILREQEINSNNSPILAPTLASGGKATSFSTGLGIDTPIDNGSNTSALFSDNNVTRKHIPSRRHWKAEARKKKS